MLRISFAFDAAAEEFVTAVLPIVTEAVRGEAPVATGALRDSVTGQPTLAGFEVRGAAPVASFITMGTKPHDIYPATASVLVFTASDGTLVFTRHVSHPGTAPNPFPQLGWRAVETHVLATAASIFGRATAVDTSIEGAA